MPLMPRPRLMPAKTPAQASFLQLSETVCEASFSHTVEVIPWLQHVPRSSTGLGTGRHREHSTRLQSSQASPRAILSPGASLFPAPITARGTEQAKVWCWPQYTGKSGRRKGPIKGLCDKNQLSRVERAWTLCTKDVGWHPTLSPCQGTERAPHDP